MYTKLKSQMKFANLITRVKNMKWWQKIAVLLLVLYLTKYIFSTFSGTEMFNGNDGGASAKANVNGKTLACTMYYAPWCGACKTAKPEWIKFENEMNGQTINGTKLVITKIDCDENPKIAEEQNIQGFPTFKFNMDGRQIDYKGGRTYNDFKQFIESIVHADNA